MSGALCDSLMFSGTRKSFLYLEAAVCFGPLAFVLFFGVLIFPIWTVMLIVYAFGSGSVDLVPDGPMLMPWLVIWPMALVACGLLGCDGSSALHIPRETQTVSVGPRRHHWRVM